MKPEDLKFPSNWDKRAIAVHDRVWCVPSVYGRYEEFTFPGWADPLFFGNNNPIHIEYCTGNGAWIAAKAAANPGINWVAVERKFKRVRKVWAKIKNLQLNNLMVICGEGANVTERYIPESSVSNVYVNFPDPWPKSRHAKHRIIQPEFVAEMWRILKDDGAMTLVTDAPDYSVEMIAVAGQHPGFKSRFDEPYFVTEWSEYGTSYFEDLWREKGKQIHYHQFIKKASS